MKKNLFAVLALCLIGALIFNSLADAAEVSGKSYIQYKYDMTDGKEGNTEFSVWRVYLNFKEKVSDKIDFRATTDIKADSTFGGKDNYYVFFVKYLHVTFKDIYQDAKLRIGQLPRPWVGFEEKIWEHRWVSKVFSDLESKLSSTGRGVSLMGKIPEGYGDYAVAYINGAGYHTKESGEYNKDVAVRLTLQPIEDKGLKLSGLYYSGLSDTTALSDATKNRIMGMLSYQADKFTVAGEVLTTDDSGKVGSGYGGFGLLKVDKFTPFVRYETFDPDTDTTDDEHTRILGGVSYNISKKVVAAIDYISKDYKDSTKTDEAAAYLHIRVKY